MNADELAAAKAWEQSSRILVLTLLFSSSVQFLVAGLVFRTIGESANDTIIGSASMLLAGVAFALGLAFRKVGAPTWKHKIAVAAVAVPAALSVLTR